MYLVQRIESIIYQSYCEYEIIILDDCSEDESWQIIEQYKNFKKTTFTIRNNKNSGSPFGLWKKGFEMAKGDFIWIAEADDFCNPDFLEKLTKSFEDSEVVVSHCRSYDYRSGTNFKKNQWWDSFREDIWEKDFVSDGKDLVCKYGRYKSPVINVSSAVFRKSALEGLEFPIDYKYCGDWWFWAQIFQKGKVSYHAEPLNYIRIHESSATAYNNLNLLLRAVEASIISRKINELLNTDFIYSQNYYWLVDFWSAAILANKELKTLREFISHMPKSFWMPVFKKIFRHYSQKYIP